MDLFGLEFINFGKFGVIEQAIKLIGRSGLVFLSWGYLT